MRLSSSTLLIVFIVALSGCTGQAGIKSDGSLEAGPGTSVITYESTSPAGKAVKFSAVVAKRVAMEGFSITVGDDGQPVMHLDSMQSGDRGIGQLADANLQLLQLLKQATGTGLIPDVRAENDVYEWYPDPETMSHNDELAAKRAETTRLIAERELLREQRRDTAHE